MVVYVLWCVLCKVRVEIERGWKMSFLSRSGFSFTYHFLVFCSFWILILYKGMTTVWIIPKKHLQVHVPSWFLFPCKLIRYQGWPTQILCSLVRSTKIPFWSPIRPPFNWIPNGLGGREWKFVYRFFDLPQQCWEKKISLPMSFHHYVCRSFLLKSSDFWGDMGTSETLLKIKSLEGANCSGRAGPLLLR